MKPRERLARIHGERRAGGPFRAHADA